MSLIEHNNSYITNSVQILLSVLISANDDISLKFSSTDMIHKTRLTLSKKRGVCGFLQMLLMTFYLTEFSMWCPIYFGEIELTYLFNTALDGQYTDSVPESCLK